jgi:hypothetical protein
MRPLKTFKEQATSDCTALREQCLARVKRWVYATGPLFAFLPMWNEMLDIKPGREIDSEKKAKLKYGFDANGRLIIAREDIYQDGSSLNETILVPVGAKAFLALISCSYLCDYRGGKKTWRLSLSWAQQLVFDAHGRVIQWMTDNGTAKYIWEGDRLNRIECEGLQSNTLEVLSYDELGRLKEVWQTNLWKTDNAHKLQTYKRPPEGISLKALEPVIRERLAAAIRNTAEAARIKQPVYCLAVAYDGEGNDMLPPCIGFGLESERQRWIKERGKEAKDMIWNPAEFGHYEKSNTQLKDKTLDKACELYNDLLRSKENFAPAIKLLNSVAVELGKADWVGKLNITPDFVAYAVDFELGDLSGNLKQSVPAATLAKLKQAKLL